MTKKKTWLKSHAGRSAAELVALEKKHRIDSILVAFEQAIMEKHERVGGDKLMDAEWTVLAIEAMEREVNNGGFLLFFVNPSRAFGPVLVDCLKSIGCPKTSAIAKRAVTVDRRLPISDKEIENGTWQENQKRNDAYEKCDAAYFLRPENIEESLFAFIKDNRKDINL